MGKVMEVWCLPHVQVYLQCYDVTLWCEYRQAVFFYGHLTVSHQTVFNMVNYYSILIKVETVILSFSQERQAYMFTIILIYPNGDFVWLRHRTIVGPPIFFSLYSQLSTLHFFCSSLLMYAFNCLLKNISHTSDNLYCYPRQWKVNVVRDHILVGTA